MEDYFIGSSFKNFQKLTDCIVKTEDGGKFVAHKIIISQSSKYFEKIFCGEFSPPTEIVVPTIKSTIFNKILCYIYQNVINLTLETIADVMVAADFLNMSKLLDDCKDYLLNRDGVVISNCLQVYNAAWKIKLQEVLQLCLRFIELHFEDVFEDAKDAVCDLPLAALKSILDNDNFIVYDESMVWNIVVVWISKNISERGLHFNDLLKFVRLQDIADSCISTLQLLPVNDENPFYYLSIEIGIIQAVATTMLLKQAKSLPRTVTGLRGTRGPKRVHLICKESITETATLYLSYDNTLDFWYPISEHRYRIFLDVCVAGRLLFLLSLNQPNILSAFDFINDTWIQNVKPVPQGRHSYCMVSVRNILYAVGGIVNVSRRDEMEDFVDFLESIQENLEEINSHFTHLNWSNEENSNFLDINAAAQHLQMARENGEEQRRIHEVTFSDNYDDEWSYSLDESSDDDEKSCCIVHFYEEKSNRWHDVKPLNPAHIIRVVSLDDSIYVIGKSETYDRMICQFYDPLEDKWTLIPNPEVYRSDCAAVVYNGSLFLIGGHDRLFLENKKVEAYNPIRNAWSFLPDLPFKFFDLEVFVFNDLLIVFEQSPVFRLKHPAVQWDPLESKWQTVDFQDREILSAIGDCHITAVKNPSLVTELIESRKRERKNWTKSCLFDMNKIEFPKD